MITLHDISGLGLVHVHPDNIEKVESVNSWCIVTLKKSYPAGLNIARKLLYVMHSRTEVLELIAECRFKHDMEQIINA